ncbi:putative quorum-quenching lactonase YtnP [bacterium BMS3Abin05]|nr:putative quorum-quenching lactonase YtnP [bacterium BMS3Abin05]GBE27823.1 putative quorum-quenching lactonase YtnP [bacterium BMS3Bbin03]HDZ12456.1 MBL fold metallo-hydrolase [Bacteroidota bacterium]
MKIGPYELYAIEHGRFKLDGGAMFGVVPKVLWEKTNPADEKNRIEMALRSLLIMGDGKVILVDTGTGTKLNDKLKSIYEIDFSAFNTEKSLNAFGLKAEDVTHVILTHLHFDHTGGATVRLNSGAVKPAFPKATYYIQKGQYAWGRKPSERDQASYFPENYVPLEEAGQLVQLKDSRELFPGIEVRRLFGHTPAMQVVKVSDGEKTLFYCADLIPTASHIPLPWIMAYDLNPLLTLEEKKMILPAAVKDHWTLMYEHDANHAATKVIFDGRYYRMGEEVKL